MTLPSLLACPFLLALVPATAQEPAAPSVPRELVIGTKEAPPFAMQDLDGRWKGISIDLWRRIAAERGHTSRFEGRDLGELFEGLQDGSLDAAVAALTLTAEREARVDFSHSFYSAGLGIAVPRESGGLLSTLGGLVSMRFLKIVAGLLALLLGVGLVVWLLERRRNRDFGGAATRGVGEGLWWAAVTMTTVGYGDRVPQTLWGRLAGLLWMFTSVMVISVFTAAIASSLTVSQLEGSIDGPEDLPGMRVGTVPGSTSAAYLNRILVRPRGFETTGAALDALARGDLDAVVYDAPLLQYQVARHHADYLQVLPRQFQSQNYAIALPQGSELREPVNRILLQITGEEEWTRSVEQTLSGG